MRKMIAKTLVASIATTLMLSGATALAISSSGSNSQRDPVLKPASDPKLSDAQMKLCRQHEKVINIKFNLIADRGQRRLNVYSNIATRVENFYTKKGKTITNYAALVADVNAKKAAAQAAIDKIKADKANFKCDGSDPKGVAEGFKADLKLEISALHDYQQAIKNLIVAVKSAQSGGGA